MFLRDDFKYVSIRDGVQSMHIYRWTEQYTKVVCQQLGYLTEGYNYYYVISVHSKCMSVYNSVITWS